jgi:hypothetical protein
MLCRSAASVNPTRWRRGDDQGSSFVRGVFCVRDRLVRVAG